MRLRLGRRVDVFGPHCPTLVWLAINYIHFPQVRSVLPTTEVGKRSPFSSSTHKFSILVSLLSHWGGDESSWVGRGSLQWSAQHSALFSQSLLGGSSWTPGPAEGLIIGNAKHTLTRLLVQVRGETASQVCSTPLIRCNTQPQCGTPSLRLPLVCGSEWSSTGIKGTGMAACCGLKAIGGSGNAETLTVEVRSTV